MGFNGKMQALTVALAALVGWSSPAAAKDTAGPTVFVNGHIHGTDGEVEAMALDGAVIVAMGSNADVRGAVGSAGKVIDLDGAHVYPGINDMHVHPLFSGLEQQHCMFPFGADPATIRATVQQCVAEAKPGEWIVGGNWVAAVFAPGEQTLDWLDSISPDNPVILEDESHHSMWANSRALAAAGISAKMPNPVGGIIERGADGRMNGLLRETAVDVVVAAAPKPTEAQMREALAWSSAEMLSYGITSYAIASVRAPEMATLAELSQSGRIKQRVRGCMVWAPQTEDTAEEGLETIARRNLYRRGRFRPDCVKIFLDGVPTESKTAAMLEPYVAHGQSTGELGTLMVPQDELERKVAMFDREGLIVKFHAAGDGAVRAGIDAVAHAREVNGPYGAMHHVGHTTFAKAADFARARDLHMGIEFSPYIWYPTPMAAVDIARVVGDVRMERWVPIKDALDAGVLVVAGSDWSVVPSVNPFLAIETMLTRQMPGGSEDVLGLSQAISFEQAMQIFTRNGARWMGLYNEVGALEVGKEGDFFLLREDLGTMDRTQIHDVKVLQTWIAGEKVFERAL